MTDFDPHLRRLMRSLITAAKSQDASATSWVRQEFGRGLEAVEAAAEPALGPPANDGEVLSSTVAGVRSWVTRAALNVAQTFTATQTFSSVITAPGIKPASNSPNAIELENAGGTAILTIDTTNGRVIAANDLLANGDTGGLFARLVNLNYTPTDHMTSFTGWTWCSTIFNGTPSLIDTVNFPSHVRFAHNTITHNHFAFQACNPTPTFSARVWVNLDSYGGIRLDDGTANNSVELRLEQTAPGVRNLVEVHTVGGTPTSVTRLTGISGQQPMTLILQKTATVYAPSFQVQGLVATPLAATVAATWTASRMGLIFGQRGDTPTDVRRSMFVDWVRVVNP